MSLYSRAYPVEVRSAAEHGQLLVGEEAEGLGAAHDDLLSAHLIGLDQAAPHCNGRESTRVTGRSISHMWKKQTDNMLVSVSREEQTGQDNPTRPFEEQSAPMHSTEHFIHSSLTFVTHLESPACRYL